MWDGRFKLRNLCLFSPSGDSVLYMCACVLVCLRAEREREGEFPLNTL